MPDPPRALRLQNARRMGCTDGEAANALVCKTSIHRFKSHSVLHKTNGYGYALWSVDASA